MKQRRGPIERLGAGLTRLSNVLVPDPYVFALLLTLLAVVAAVFALMGTSPPDAATSGDLPAALIYAGESWWGGLFRGNLLTFAFQMCLVLVTGHALALSAPVQALLRRVSSLARGTTSAALIVAAVALASGIIHWGLGAVLGAFLAREIGKNAAERGIRLHYPLLGAAAYMGLMVWHGGLSGSAPLTIALDDHFLHSVVGTVDLGVTTFSRFNLIVTGAVCATVLLVFWLLVPSDPEGYEPYRPARSAEAWDADIDPASARGLRHLEHSSALGLTMGLAIIAFTVYGFREESLTLNLNTVNLAFLGLGMTFQGTPLRYARAVADGAKGCSGIILQFPLYFGILGLLQGSGLVQWFSGALAGVASADTLPLFTLASAGIVNLFVPSGGGQWAVQGQVIMEAAQQLGADPTKTIMAFCYGDALTNMLQPFWALPLLAITGLKARQIVGYTAAVMVLVIPVLVVLLLLL